jgi:glucose-1-phosphate cytidylyltransferase
VSNSDNGEDTQTGGRLRRIREELSDPFIMTYGDGLADVNYYLLLDHHQRMRKSSEPMVTLTAANPPSRFGNLQIINGRCEIYTEKGQDPRGWINAGFYVCDASIVEMVPGDNCIWEKDILPALALQGRLAAYQHPGEFQMVDTWRDLRHLEKIYQSGDPFWERYANAS